MTQPPPAAVAPAPLPRAPRGGFVLLVGADTVGVEHVARGAAGFEGELFLRAQRQRVAYTVAADDDGRVHRVQLYQWAPGAPADARPAATLQYRFDADTVVVTGSAGSVSLQRLPVPPGTLPWVNPSFAFAEQLTRRARRLGATIDGLRRELPVVNLGTGARSAIVATALGRDPMLLDFGGAELRLAVDSAGAVLGGRLPAQGLTVVRAGALDPAAGRSGPSYAPPPGAPYAAEEVRIPTPGGHVLAATLTRPARGGRAPVAVTISGSGPQDRDGQILGLPDYRPFRLLADTLGRRGVAVLRFDERGVGGSGGAFGTATTRDFADDVRAVVAWLRARPDVDPARVALVGHSEGGVVAPLVAAEDPGIAAVALLAAPAVPGRRLLDWQAAQGAPRELAGARRDSAEAARRRALDAAIAQSPWLRWFAAHDPGPAARRVRVPALVLHGATDRQVPPEQADTLAALLRAGGNRAVTVRVLAGVDHLLVDDPSGAPAGYAALPSRAVSPRALGAIADWLASALRAR